MKNLFAATYAPMHTNYELNLDVVESYAGLIKNNRIDGVFINGSTGDFVSLSTSERQELLTEWAKHSGENLYLINHVGHTNLVEAQKLAKHSNDKADAIAALAPFYFVPRSSNQLVEYCASIAENAPDLPFYYYHLPALTGVQFSMVEFAQKAKKEISTFAGIKFSENNVVEFQKLNCKEPGLDIFFGVDQAFLSSLPLNTKGWVGSTYNHLAPLYHKIQKAFCQGDFEEANHLQTLSINFIEVLSKYGGFNGAGKSFMKKIGIDCGPSRFPHSTLSEQELEEVEITFQKLRKEKHFCQL